MIRQYMVDAFTDEVFRGNPAAVCVLEAWPDDQLMKNIALENNLSETAFIVKEPAGYHLPRPADKGKPFSLEKNGLYEI